jgi:pyruvate dehydrogenase E2 component (dihydrolipoamide acetyltransferase)
MPTDFKFPDVGEGITEGEIVEWEVKEGETVQEHQPIVKIETDKAVVEIPSPRAGKILMIYHKEGDTVKVGETLVTIGDLGERFERPEVAPVRPKVSVVGVLEEAPEAAAGPSKILTTPATRRLASELGIDISQVKGTGLDGRVTEQDLRRFSEERGKKPEITKIARKYDLYGYIEAVPMKGVRKSTAKRMVESSRTAVNVTHMDEADVTYLVKIREREKQFSEKQGVHLTFIPFVMKAVIAALKQYSYLNSSVDDEHEEIILKKYYNIGVAVDTDEGLIVPVVKGADQKSILKIAQEIQELSQKTRSRTVDLADLKGGTFTITNIGVIGGLHATPIVNYPETSILATGRIYEKPVVWDGKVVIRKVMPLSLSFDHRVIDGAMAAKFLNAIIRYLEDPDLLLIEGE